MLKFIQKLFASDFMPHGMCFFWNPPVLWLNVISDAVISISYYAIPILLFLFFRRRRDLTFRWVFVAFAAFIVACGTTHVMGIWTVWHGTYRLDGAVKAVTAGASLLTAILLVPLLPMLVRLPSPSELARLNEELDQRVGQRTAELEGAAVALKEEIQERRRVEAALETSERQYRLLFEGNPQPMWVYDTRTLRFLAMNRAAIEHYGYTREEFFGMTIKDIRPPEEIPALMESVSRDTAGIERSRDWVHRKKDGILINVEISSHPLDFHGRPARLVLANDCTERRRLEDQLRQSQKMDAVGRLAGGVAHDFNNLLTVISGYGELMHESIGVESELRKPVDEIRRAAERAASLTSQLLAFSRQQILVPSIIDLNQIVVEVHGMLQRLLGEDIEISLIMGRDLGQVKADPGQIGQVLINLAVNARDAMPRGGRLTIETANADLDNSYAAAHMNVKPGRYVMLAVSDSGMGMDEETRSHVFEPFFTTKELGRGTGLGLSTVHGIINQSNGHIWLYSEPGRGTTFRIYLPRTGGTGEEGVVAERPAIETQIQRGVETILLIEDDAPVRSFIRHALEGGGYRVLEAVNGTDAVQKSREYNGMIHVVLTDVVMPGMGGRDAAAALTAGRRGIKVLYMSGYTNDAIVLHELLEAKVPYLQKPFSSATLLRRIRELLNGTD